VLASEYAMLNFADKKRQTLERRLTAVVEEWEALSNELLQNRDVSDRLRIQRQIDQLEIEIKRIESDLRELDALVEAPIAVVASPAPAASDVDDAVTAASVPTEIGSATALKVFLCHGKEDKEAVRKLYDRLQAAGVEPWLDEHRLLPGQRWKSRIRRAVRESHVVLVCLSSQTVRKESFLQEEIQVALDVAERQAEDSIFLIPLRFEDCEVPARVRELHWVDYFTPGGYDLLMQALEVHAGEIGVVLRRASPAVVETPPAVPEPSALLEVRESLVESHESAPDLRINERDGAELALIPAGEFTMGSDAADDERPIHTVHLDAYYIYKTPVTVGQYRQFCEATDRQMPPAPGFNRDWQKVDHPIVNVSWIDAKAYCDWAEAYLPTEAEWEKAARGRDGRVYPWGEKWDAGCCVNGTNSQGGTAPVGSYLADTSPFGVLDMAGNVWEWCSDWYDENYYRISLQHNPPGPEKGTFRVLRGGSWIYIVPDLFRCAIRDWDSPDFRYNLFGFRCVVRLNPA
jgi:formylglycine-generating enzyme required for sulfatase activity